MMNIVRLTFSFDNPHWNVRISQMSFVEVEHYFFAALNFGFHMCFYLVISTIKIFLNKDSSDCFFLITVHMNWTYDAEFNYFVLIVTNLLCYCEIVSFVHEIEGHSGIRTAVSLVLRRASYHLSQWPYGRRRRN